MARPQANRRNSPAGSTGVETAGSRPLTLSNSQDLWFARPGRGLKLGTHWFEHGQRIAERHPPLRPVDLDGHNFHYVIGGSTAHNRGIGLHDQVLQYHRLDRRYRSLMNPAQPSCGRLR